ncbi:cadherin-like domain-containing protein [Mangrovibacter sp. SLW1]
MTGNLSGTTAEDTPVTVNVLGAASDVDGDVLSVTTANAGNGTVTINPDGTLTYRPAPNFNGTDTLSWMVSDGKGVLQQVRW